MKTDVHTITQESDTQAHYHFFLVPHLSVILECINRIREDRVEQTTWRQSSTDLTSVSAGNSANVPQRRGFSVLSWGWDGAALLTVGKIRLQ